MDLDYREKEILPFSFHVSKNSRSFCSRHRSRYETFVFDEKPTGGRKSKVSNVLVEQRVSYESIKVLVISQSRIRREQIKLDVHTFILAREKHIKANNTSIRF